ncbi:MAG: pro-sigmaK processing inhibitor BofA family protein [Clostridiaceae bacterium]
MFPSEIFYGVIGLFLLVIFFKFFSWPIKMLMKFIINGILGAVLLIIVNFLGSAFGITIAINMTTALIAGFFGIPGVVFMIIFKLFF